MAENYSTIARLERAIGSRGGALSGDGSPSQRLAACAAYFGGLGITVEPEESALETALRGLGTDPGSAEFDSSADAEARAQRVAAEQADAEAQAAKQAADDAAAQAAADAQARAAADAQAAATRLAALEANAAALEQDASAKEDAAAVARERADEAKAELEAARA